MAAKPIPDGYTAITPYICVDGAATALDFYKQAFDAKELYRMNGPGGKVMHCEFKIGNAIIMMADEFPEMDFRGPLSIGGSPIGLMIYCEDCDKMFHQAVAAGATIKKPLQDQFYGDRSGTVTDPFGHVWTVSTHKEDLTSEEIGKRMAAMGQCG